MQAIVMGSFFAYVLVFVVCQQIIGAKHKARNIRCAEYPLFYVYIMLSQALLLPAVITMAGEPLNNLLVVRVAGLVIVVLGLALTLWAQHELGRYWVGGIALHKDHKLVTTGPYKYVRHPLYSGMLLSAIGLCLVSLNVFYGSMSLIFCGAYALRAVHEDQLLRKKFKKHYEQYEARTGAIFPRLRR
jgi:protein-S-isoprenylcysteine O-methyltransferase Ste14